MANSLNSWDRVGVASALRGILFLLGVWISAGTIRAETLALLRFDPPSEAGASPSQAAEWLDQELAKRPGVKIYDLRARNRALLDSLGDFPPDARTAGALRAPDIDKGLWVACDWVEGGQANSPLRCRIATLSLKRGALIGIDTLLFRGRALRQPDFLMPALARRIFSEPVLPHSDSAGPAPLRLSVEASPARLLKDLEILATGRVDSLPLGATLELGDAEKPAVARLEGYDLILYPGSQMRFLLPGVVQLEHGRLGVMRKPDSNKAAGALGSMAAFDSSNLVLRSVVRLAAMDSTNLLWGAFAKAEGDSQTVSLSRVRALAALDSTNPLFGALGQVASLDSSNLVLKTLGRMAALDSTNLLWQGLGSVTGLDSGRSVWKRMSGISDWEAADLWRKLGLLAFRDSLVLVTRSAIMRGAPEAMRVRQEDALARFELGRGRVWVSPLLGAESSTPLGDLEWAETRGFTVSAGRMNGAEGEAMVQALAAALPKKEGAGWTRFLPGKLFAEGRTVETFPVSVQAWLGEEIAEFGATADRILKGPTRPQAPTGESHAREAAGCYLCSPSRLGP